ncbi:unnamed protein product [Eruca vesicaria subsp. sativa]|uniref:Uncharacterized protein n=1 Tax=Eruca vesicaria subsp. sativa TaxID=29727 RepID=A0ABC8LNP3_ERUVS|nr:unnamed protein product [Eruca vesicaria subsp. sativa]
MAKRKGRGQGDATMDDRVISKKRKLINDEVNDSDEECKKSKTQEVGSPKPSGRVVEGGDEEEVVVAERPEQPKERIWTARWNLRPPRWNSHLHKTVSRCMHLSHHHNKTRRKMLTVTLQH